MSNPLTDSIVSGEPRDSIKMGKEYDSDDDTKKISPKDVVNSLKEINKQIEAQKAEVSSILAGHNAERDKTATPLKKWNVGEKDEDKTIDIDKAVEYHNKTALPKPTKLDNEYKRWLGYTEKAEKTFSHMLSFLKESLTSFTMLKGSFDAMSKHMKSLMKSNKDLKKGAKEFKERFDVISKERDEMSKKMKIWQQFIIDKDKQLVESLKREKAVSYKLRNSLKEKRLLMAHKEQTLKSLFAVARQQKLSVADVEFYYGQALEKYKEFEIEGKRISTGEIDSHFKTLENIHESIIESTIRMLRTEGVPIKDQMYLRHKFIYYEMMKNEGIEVEEEHPSASQDETNNPKYASRGMQTSCDQELPYGTNLGYVEDEEPLDGFRDCAIQCEAISSLSAQQKPKDIAVQTDMTRKTIKDLYMEIKKLKLKTKKGGGGSSVDLNSDLSDRVSMKIHKRTINQLINRTIDTLNVVDPNDTQTKEQCLELLNSIEARSKEALAEHGLSKISQLQVEKCIEMKTKCSMLRDDLEGLKTVFTEFNEDIQLLVEDLTGEFADSVQEKGIGDMIITIKKRRRRKRQISETQQKRKKAPELLKYLKMMLRVKKRQLGTKTNSDGKKTNKYKSEREELLATFKTFDQDGDGSITALEFQEGMKLLGQNLSKKQVQGIMDEVDQDGNGEIDYLEFIDIMLGEDGGEDSKKRNKLMRDYNREEKKKEMERQKELEKQKEAELKAENPTPRAQNARLFSRFKQQKNRSPRKPKRMSMASQSESIAKSPSSLRSPRSDFDSQRKSGNSSERIRALELQLEQYEQKTSEELEIREKLQEEQIASLLEINQTLTEQIEQSNSRLRDEMKSFSKDITAYNSKIDKNDTKYNEHLIKFVAAQTQLSEKTSQLDNMAKKLSEETSASTLLRSKNLQLTSEIIKLRKIITDTATPITPRVIENLKVTESAESYLKTLTSSSTVEISDHSSISSSNSVSNDLKEDDPPKSDSKHTKFTNLSISTERHESSVYEHQVSHQETIEQTVEKNNDKTPKKSTSENTKLPLLNSKPPVSPKKTSKKKKKKKKSTTFTKRTERTLRKEVRDLRLFASDKEKELEDLSIQLHRENQRVQQLEALLSQFQQLPMDNFQAASPSHHSTMSSPLNNIPSPSKPSYSTNDNFKGSNRQTSNSKLFTLSQRRQHLSKSHQEYQSSPNLSKSMFPGVQSNSKLKPLQPLTPTAKSTSKKYSKFKLEGQTPKKSSPSFRNSPLKSGVKSSPLNSGIQGWHMK